MTMRLKPTYQNHLKDWIKGTIILYGILILVYLLGLIFLTVKISGDGDSIFSGMESIPQIFIFVCGITMFKPNLKLALANGISRKTEFTVMFLSASTIAVMIMVLNIGIGCLFGTIYDYQSMFAMSYKDYNFGNDFAYYITGFFFDTLNNISSFVFGYFIGALYYRMPKPLKIAVSVGVPVLLFIGLPVGTVIFGKNSFIYNLVVSIGTFIEKVAENPYYTIISSIVTIIVIEIFSFLLMRRAPIKEQG